MSGRFRNLLNRISPEQRAELAKRAAVGLFGLVLGLFLGWVVWPIEWTNATLDDLNPALKAQYLSALADAYVATGGTNAEATLARLADLQDIETSFSAAIQYYQERSDPIRQLNLRALAVAVGADDAVVQALQEQPTQSTGQAGPEVDWIRWGLITLAAVVLLASGLAIAVWLYRSGKREKDAPDADELSSMGAEDGWDLDEFQADPALSHDEQMQWWLGRTEAEQPVEPAPRADWPAESSPSETSYQEEAQRPILLETDVGMRAEPASREQDTEEDQEEDRSEAGEAGETLIFPPQSPAQHSAQEEEAGCPDSAPLEAEQPQTTTPEPHPAPLPDPKKRTNGTAGAPAPEESAAGREKKTGAEKAGFLDSMQGAFQSLLRQDEGNRKRRALASFTAHYEYGIPDYDESFTITAAEGEETPLGACGVGTEIDPQAANREDVQILVVWLYDRSDSRSYNQILVGRSVEIDAVPTNIESSGTITGEPLVAEPGLTFQLQGKSLLLHCRVDHVEYLDGYPGIRSDGDLFRKVTVTMTVYRT